MSQHLPAAATSTTTHALEDIEQTVSPNPVSSHAVTPEPAAKKSKWYPVWKWFANISALGGGAAFAVIPTVALEWWSYIPFFISHVIWSIFGYRLGEKELMWLNLGALGLDIWAIIVRLM